MFRLLWEGVELKVNLVLNKNNKSTFACCGNCNSEVFERLDACNFKCVKCDTPIELAKWFVNSLIILSSDYGDREENENE